MFIGIAGAAGSGKDTVAGFIAKYSRAVCIAQADPMKRFAHQVFGFTEHQLWGPSDARNAPDDRYDEGAAWDKAHGRLNVVADEWLREVLPTLNDRSSARVALRNWFFKMAEEHGWRVLPGQRMCHSETFGGFGPSIARVMGGKKNKPLPPTRQLTPRYVLQTLGTEWGREFSANMWNDCALRTGRALLDGGREYTRLTGLTINGAEAGPEYVIITDIRFRNEVLGVRERNGIVLNITSPHEDNSAVEKAGVKGHRSEAELKGVPLHWYRYGIVNDKSLGLLLLENKVQGLTRKLRSFEVW